MKRQSIACYLSVFCYYRLSCTAIFIACPSALYYQLFIFRPTCYLLLLGLLCYSVHLFTVYNLSPGYYLLPHSQLVYLVCFYIPVGFSEAKSFLKQSRPIPTYMNMEVPSFFNFTRSTLLWSTIYCTRDCTCLFGIRYNFTQGKTAVRQLKPMYSGC